MIPFELVTFYLSTDKFYLSAQNNLWDRTELSQRCIQVLADKSWCRGNRREKTWYDLMLLSTQKPKDSYVYFVQTSFPCLLMCLLIYFFWCTYGIFLIGNNSFTAGVVSQVVEVSGQHGGGVM